MRFLSLAILLLPTLAFAQDGVRVSDAWAASSMGQPTGVGFMTLHASSDDALIGIASDCCKAVEMHSMTMDGEVMHMRRVERIELPGDEDVALESGGYHLMLIGLKKPLDEGDAVKLKLSFDHAAAQDVTLAVKARDEEPMDHEHMGHH